MCRTTSYRRGFRVDGRSASPRSSWCLGACWGLRDAMSSEPLKFAYGMCSCRPPTRHDRAVWPKTGANRFRFCSATRPVRFTRPSSHCRVRCMGSAREPLPSRLVSRLSTHAGAQPDPAVAVELRPKARSGVDTPAIPHGSAGVRTSCARVSRELPILRLRRATAGEGSRQATGPEQPCASKRHSARSVRL